MWYYLSCMPQTPLPFTLGVELEVNPVTNAGNDVERLSRHFRENAALAQRLNGWRIKTDGSCGVHGGMGVEIVSPILRTEEELHDVRLVCRELAALGFKVNQHCGLHVHVGVDHLRADARERLFRFFVAYENAFYLLEPTRKNNRYCLPLQDTLKAELQNGAGYDAWNCRYRWLNGCAYSEHGTLEFRLMGGSIDANHIIGWCDFLLHCFTTIVNNTRKTVPWGTKPDTQQVRLLAEMLHELDLAAVPPANKAREKSARAWALSQSAKLQTARSLAEIRAERRRRLLEAWKGRSKFTPVPANETFQNVLEAELADFVTELLHAPPLFSMNS